MLHLVFCFSVWTLIFIWLSWRLIVVAQQGINHLKRIHQIPCSSCTYFTGDYRLKCTVNPMLAMSESAIGCRDYSYTDHRPPVCRGCQTKSSDGKSGKQSVPYSSVN